MPDCLTVTQKIFPIRQVTRYQSALVPWEVRGYFEDYETSRRVGGFFDLTHWGVIEIAGEDAADYLQRMSTANVNGLTAGSIAHAAFLTGKAHPITLGFLERAGSGYLHLVPPPLATVGAEHLERFHFAEKLTVTDVSDRWGLLGLWNPEDGLCSSLGIRKDSTPLSVHASKIGGIPFEWWRDDSRPALFWVRMGRDTVVPFIENMRTEGAEPLGYRLFEYYRIASGVPQVGKEAQEGDIILEANYDRAIARNKGCYPGQEVVERIFTYGQVNRKLLPVTVDSSRPLPEPPFPITLDGKAVGTVVAYMENPENPAVAAGLAYLRKEHWGAKEVFESPAGTNVRLRGDEPSA